MVEDVTRYEWWNRVKNEIKQGFGYKKCKIESRKKLMRRMMFIVPFTLDVVIFVL